MDKNVSESIKVTKEGFEASFKEGKLYDIQTQDELHLNKILEAVILKENDVVLDLGCGSGYLTFALSRKYPYAKILGIDIIEKTLDENKKIAESENIKNVSIYNI